MRGRTKAALLRVEQPEQRDASAHAYGFAGARLRPLCLAGIRVGVRRAWPGPRVGFPDFMSMIQGVGSVVNVSRDAVAPRPSETF